MWLWKVLDLRLDADSCSRLLCSKSSSVGVTLDLLLIRLISKFAFYQLKNISRLPPTSPPALNTAVASAFQSPVQSPVCSAVTLTIHQPYPYASSCLPVEFSIYKCSTALTYKCRKQTQFKADMTSHSKNHEKKHKWSIKPLIVKQKHQKPAGRTFRTGYTASFEWLETIVLFLHQLHKIINRGSK